MEKRIIIIIIKKQIIWKAFKSWEHAEGDRTAGGAPGSPQPALEGFKKVD